MITKEKKVVLLAENSKTIQKLIEKVLHDNNYDVIICEDGFKAMRKILSEKPDCIIADKVLPNIDGYQLCSLIKKGSERTNTPFIIFSAEDEVSDYWADTSEANALFSLSGNNLNELIEIINGEISSRQIDIEFFTEDEEILEDISEEGTLTMCAVRAMDQSNFFYNMMKEIFKLNGYIEDLDEFIEQIFLLLQKICLYDAAVVILSDTISTVYSTGLENMPESEVDSFFNICRTDFENATKHENGNTYNYNYMEGIVTNPPKRNIFCSYMSFPIESNGIIGTIHMASKKKKFFTYKVQSSISFLVGKINYALQEAIIHRHVTLSEQKLRSVFSKFVPEEIIEDLLKQDDTENENPNNEKRRVAVLICDIRNFTTISEINQPENVVSFLNGYFTRMVDVIKSHGGSIDKFIGDAIMALFGAPISYVDNAQRAVEAALEMISILPEMPTELLTFPDGMNFDIGIGIHQGEMIVGNIGCKDKTNYTVIGDSVNLTSRLEGLTKQYGSRIIISQDVRTELNDSINCLMLDKVKVKGKNQGVDIYSVDEKALPKAFVDNYEKGLNLYLSGAWSLALTYLQKAQDIRPADKASKVLINRCNEFIQNPPEEWSGAVALTSK